MNHDDRLRLLESQHARHDVQLENQERVVRSLETHLATIVERISSFEKKTYVLAAVIFASSPTAAKFLSGIAHFFA